MLAYSCSTKKNTGLTRRIKAVKAKYNTYYNGHLAFIEGLEAQEKANKDNYSEIIPLFMTGNKGTVSAGKSNFDRTIEKCQKTIKKHSITKRPEWKSNKPKTQKDKVWLSQKEYNPFLHNAWFLMADAQFHKGEYLEAAAIYSYIQQLYFSSPDIIAKARMLEAKCYAEMEWFYDAENVINTALRDSFPSKYEHMKALALAASQIRQAKYEDAIPNLKAAIKNESGLQKSRMYFLLGQLYHKTGNQDLAYKAFKKVISRNPPYELEFNARIQQTEVMSKGNGKKTVRKLMQMAKSPKNKDFLDQVYCAIGNIYMAEGDTVRAIGAYREGVEKSTRNGMEKGVVMLKLGQLYYETEEFVKAQECYSGVIGLIDKDREDYEDIDERSKILDELLPFAQAVELQDSLQALAKMDSVERMKVIENIIKEVKRKEKEEARNLQDAKTAGKTAGRPGAANASAAQNRGGAGRQPGGRQSAVWYFYNPTAVAAGKAEFKKKWGERSLEDDWRRKNRTVLGFTDETVAEAGDSLSADSTGVAMTDASAASEEDTSKAEEYANDPHRPEFYLKDIPFTDEQMAASNAALVDGLFNSAVIFKDRMEIFPLAEKTLLRVINDFPEYEGIDETYYNLYQLYTRLGRHEEAQMYKEKLIAEYPDNLHGQKIADPNYEFKARYGKQVEDSLYQEAYSAFKAGEYADVVRMNEYLAKEYPEGANRARSMFITAVSRLEMGERNQFMGSLKEIVEKYPQSTVSELAGLYVKGLQEGRLLASGKMEMGSIWDRRGGVGMGADSTITDTAFTMDVNTDFVFVAAYEHDSINENQMLYEMAYYNFSNFTVRNFDMSFEKADGIDMFQVRTFLNFEEAYIYMHRLMNNEEMARKLEGVRMFVISENNLKLLMRGRSFAEYFEFFDANFGTIIPSEFVNSTLDEPTELPAVEEDEDDGGEEYEEEENWIF